ncbi:hybrid sensor histidine kinase/response regulator transcription factor [Nibrella saemangeumensis]|uniref:histidine kinase n=1 Tax=Nibrella saemangeumensis TaxID=1084526 RepID=A0ABP8MTF6_9BACT
MRLLSFLLVYLSFWLTAVGQQPRVYFEQLTTADGLPDNSVNVILQDHLGFMWLGTRNGLVRYDGVTMTVFQNNPRDPFSLKGRIVTCLYEDRQGNIWVGCWGGLYRFERSTQRFISYSPKGKDAIAARQSVQFIHEDKNGSIWVVIVNTDEEQRLLSRYEPTTDTWTHYRHREGDPNSLMHNQVLYMSATGHIRNCLLEDALGTIWVVTRTATIDGAEAILHRYDRAHDRFIPYFPKGIAASDSVFRFIKYPRFDRKSTLWVPTFKHGLLRVDPVANRVITHYRHVPGDDRSLLCDSVRTVYEDRAGYLWVSTRKGLDQLDPRTGIFTHHRYEPANEHTPHDMVVDAIEETANGHIWFTTTVGGLDEYNPQTGLFTRYETNAGYPGGLIGELISKFLVDKSGLIWASTVGFQLAGLNRQSRITRFTPLLSRATDQGNSPTSAVSVVYEAPSEPGVLWIGTTRGLDRFDRKTGKIIQYRLDLATHININSVNRVTALTEDARGQFWVATTNGLYLMDRRRGTFTHFQQDPMRSNRLHYHVITALLAARDSTLWIGSNTGLDHYNSTTKQFTYYGKADTTYHPALFRLLASVQVPVRQLASIRHSEVTPEIIQTFSLKEPSDVAISALGAVYPSVKNEHGWLEDATGRVIWELNYKQTRMGGRRKRIQIDAIHLRAGSYYLHYKSRIFPGMGKNATGYATEPTSYYPELWGIQLVRITPAEADSLNRLKKRWMYNGLSSWSVQALHQDKKGRIWIGTNNGLNQFEPRTGRFIHYRDTLNNLVSIRSVHEDSNGILWLGDNMNGLFRHNPDNGVVNQYTTADGLSHNSITSIQADGRGQLWLSTYNGICRFDPKTQQFRTYTTANGLSGMIFRYPSFRSADGSLFFLGEHGINTLAPDQRYDDPQPPRLALTEVDIFNQKATIGPDEPLQKHISVAEKLTLAHDQNDVTFHFAALHYTRPAECRYAVRLEPYDKDWVALGTARQVRYMALAPGTYTFRVKAANADGVWNQKGVSVQVVVLPPWWQTWWAYALYALAFGGLVLAFIRYRVEQGRQQQEMAFKRREAEQLRAMDELKTRFFSNITHEFRTPLSLIMAPTETLLEGETLPAKQGLLTTIQRNAKQLLNLINQLLDLSKLEAGKMAVSERQGNLSEFVGQLVETFRPMALQRQLTLTFAVDDLPGDYIFDAGKWERIISNLLANALKFTPEQGTVMVSLRADTETSVRLTISDTGIGIAPDKLPHIFDRFYQADDSRTRTYEGTGIGLALVKELTDLLGGSITVRSQVNQGTQVELIMPVRPAQELPAPAAVTAPEPMNGSPVLPHEPVTSNALTEPGKPVVLLAEDNTELREFMAQTLSAEFRVITAANGEEGWQLAQQEIPDLVISDIMMPVMDGYALCRQLKTHPATNHVAVVLLTARSSQESRLEGFQYGADEYLTKPFHVGELQMRVRNIVAHQQKLRRYYAGQLSAVEEPLQPEAVQDPFLQQVYGLLDAHLDDSTFGVDQLAEGLAMSRRTLHRKLTTLIELSAGDVIRQYRLKRAAELLRQGYPVAQTAYQVGFESPQYFSRAFKEFYQYTPSEFVNRLAG